MNTYYFEVDFYSWSENSLVDSVFGAIKADNKKAALTVLENYFDIDTYGPHHIFLLHQGKEDPKTKIAIFKLS